MQEFQCSNCGYRKWEKDPTDFMLDMPIFGSFGTYNMMPVASVKDLSEDMICPNCGKSFGWNPIINNDNF